MAFMPEDGVARGLRPLPVAEETISEPEEVTWVKAARNGDREAFTCLYYRYARLVHGVLLAKVPISDVDDLVQDTFIVAWKRIASLREPSSFGAWIATVARNLAHDHHRRAAPEDSLHENAAEDFVSSEPCADGKNLDAREVLEALRALPETYREILILRLVEGLSGPEIAARTGLTHGSVRVNLHRGMEQLRAKLKAGSGGSKKERQ
jgi:RNA polymerase sigma-70 factor (ECF subfamily)